MKTIKIKQTAIPWLGEIPESWEVRRLKYIASIETGFTPLKANKDNYSNDGIPWIKPDNLNGLEYLMDSKEKISAIGLGKNPVIKKDDVLVCCIGTVGKMGVAGCDLTFNQQINSVSFNDLVIKDFGKYLILSSQDEHLYNSQVVVLSILNKTKQSNIKFPLPPLQTQKDIADYLDEKTEKIKKLIDDKKKMIELLKEKKQSIIHQAVTKGIDKNAKMKESGIAWIGEIPEGWKISPLNYIGRIILGKMLCSVDKNNMSKKPYLKSKNVGWISPVLNNVEEMWFTNAELKKYRIEKGDMLISEGGEVGKSFLWNDELPECYIQNSVHKITFHKDLASNSYYLYIFFIYGVLNVFDSIVGRVSIAHLTREKLIKLKIPLPPLQTQKEIVAHIEKESATIDTAISKIEEQIKLIEEYKKSLIYHAVTGKIAKLIKKIL